MTLFIAGRKNWSKKIIHIWNVLGCKPVEMRFHLFFGSIIDPLSPSRVPISFFFLSPHLSLFPLLTPPLLLFPLRGKLAMTLPRLLDSSSYLPLCCCVFSNTSNAAKLRRLDDWRENKETEGCCKAKGWRRRLRGAGGGLKAPGGLFAVQETQAPAEQSINTVTGEESLAFPSIPSLFGRCVFKPFDLLIARTA